MSEKLKIFLVYFLIIIGVLEIFSRISGKHISYAERSADGGSYNSPFETGTNGWDNTPEPNQLIEYHKTEFDTKWLPNNEGLKNKKLALQKTGKRILIFGDSFTEGVGACNDSAYPRILETLIHASLDSTAEIINCGLCASDVFTEYKLFVGKMLKYKPDYVLITFNSTDIYEYTIRGGFERFMGDNQLQYRQSPWFEPLYAHSYLVRRIVHDIFHLDYNFQKTSEYDIINRQAAKELSIAIDSFSQMCSSKQIAFGIIFHPMGNEYPTDSNHYQNLPLINHCQKKQIAYVDENSFLLEHYIDSNNMKSLYWPKDGHYNRKGYEWLARCAYYLFEQQGWLLTDKKVSLTNIHQQP